MRTEFLNGFKQGLFVAGAIVGLSGVAHAAPGSLNGSYSTSSLTGASLTKEAAGAAKPVVPLSADAQAAADAAAAQKAEVVSQLLDALADGTVDAYGDYAGALADQGTAAAAAAAAAKALTAAEAAKAKADALVTTLATAKSAADAKVASATAAQTTALASQSTLVASGTATAAQLAAAQAAVDQAQVGLDLAIAAQEPVTDAYSLAVSDADLKLDAYADAITAKGGADADVLTANADVTSKSSLLTAALATDTEFAAKLAAVNGAAGTAFTATYEGIKAIGAYDDAPAAAKYASNGYTRTITALTAAASSSNQYIAMASGALTGSTAALDAGANYETEVLSALVDHEGRITQNTTDIGKNTAAITQEVADRKAAVLAEETARKAAVLAEETARKAAVLAEETARKAADATLQKNIDAEAAARSAGDRVLRDKIASSTATAIAMGGNAILPDVNFTLAGNVATYQGAQAISINGAAKIGENKFITGAIGGGLNKKGSIGGRVGFVMGF